MLPCALSRKPSKAVIQEQRKGAANAFAAYFMWGIAPVYFKLVDFADASEIMVHRIIWSCLFLGLIIVVSKKWQTFVAIVSDKKLVARLALSACFLAFNWFMFIWAVNNDLLLDASLGYYINPLFTVALAMIFLGERLRKWQQLAVLLALIGVAIQVIALGKLPIVSLALAGSFAIYGLLRKQVSIDSLCALLVESLLMLPVALYFWVFYLHTDTSNLFNNTINTNVLLMFAGIVTTAPLLCFTAATKRLNLATLGFFQYIGPTFMFFLATWVYNEDIVIEKLVTFAFIWTALMLYSWDSYRYHQNSKVRG